MNKGKYFLIDFSILIVLSSLQAADLRSNSTPAELHFANKKGMGRLTAHPHVPYIRNISTVIICN
jgi:hypothetical protein